MMRNCSFYLKRKYRELTAKRLNYHSTQVKLPRLRYCKNLSFYTLSEIPSPKKIRHEREESKRLALALAFFGLVEKKKSKLQTANVSLTGLSHGREVKLQFQILEIPWHFQKIMCSPPHMHGLKLIAWNCTEFLVYFTE